GRNQIGATEARGGKVGTVEARLLCERTDQVGAPQISSGKVGPSEHRTVYLHPAQIEPGEISPAQIGGCEICAMALVIFCLEVKPVRTQHVLDFVAESTRTGFRSVRSAIPAKGDRGLSESVMQ